MSAFWQINIGHVITIVGGVVSIVIVWQKLRDKVDDLAQRMTRSESDLDQLTKMGLMTTVQQHERRLQTLEDVANDVRGMKSDLNWIKEKLNH